MEALPLAGIIIVIAMLRGQAAPATRAQAGPGGTYISIPGVGSYSNVPGQGVSITLMTPTPGAGSLVGPQIAEWPSDVPYPSYGKGMVPYEWLGWTGEMPELMQYAR